MEQFAYVVLMSIALTEGNGHRRSLVQEVLPISPPLQLIHGPVAGA